MPTVPGFLDQPKTDHHIQAMLLVAIVVALIVVGWLYAALRGSSPKPVQQQAPVNAQEMQQAHAKAVFALLSDAPAVSKEHAQAVFKLLK